MGTEDVMSIDALLERLGGCGLFQVIAALTLHGATMASPWSMMFMAFGNYNPGWTCTDPDVNISYNTVNGATSLLENKSLDHADDQLACSVYQQCQNVVFNNGSSTIVTEWQMVCDKSWIMSLMISLQMGGVLVGVLSAGQMNIVLGRKTSLYGSMALHALLNLIASFSTNWPMFTVMRFCLGVTCGCIMLCAYVYPLEFITNKWRGLVTALPFSNTSFMSFSVAAMLLKDWRLLHRATAIFTAVLMLPAFWAPDSLRWLAIKDEQQKAERAIIQISKTNRKTTNVDMTVIKDIAEREKEIKKTHSHYTIVDLYRHGLLKRTLILTSIWLTNTIIYYTFVFDVKSISGNFYVNLIIFSSINLFSVPFVPAFTNTIGRKGGMIILMCTASICCFLLVAINFIEGDFNKDLAKMILTLMTIVFLDAEWAILQLVCLELYPTMLRPLSFSHGSCIGRLGGMIAPFIIPRDPSSAYISQIIMTILLLLSSASLCFLPETKDQALEETMTSTKDKDCERRIRFHAADVETDV